MSFLHKSRFSHKILGFILFFALFSPSVFAPFSHAASVKASIPEDERIDFWSDYPHEELAEALCSRMSDEELFAQILMFGWAGQEASPLLIRWVSERKLGSVKVFGWNTDDIIQVAQAVTLLQQKAQADRFKIPLYVATDQEGGPIRHVKGRTSDTPGNLAIGAAAYPADAWYSGYYIAKELRALGINMNFAPTVDLYTNFDSSVIGSRSFDHDPHFSGIMGASFAAGCMAAGVIPTAKHFPGHGDTGADSHGKLPVIDIDLQTMRSRELIPFEYLIRAHIPAVMSGHLSFPQIVEGNKPASLSGFFLTDLLRGEMGFDGLIITDDMMMNGATSYTGAVSAAVSLAVEAGNDIVISSTTAQWEEPMWRHNIDRMKTDKTFKQAVLRSAKHVVFSKLKYFKSENPVPLFPDIKGIDAAVPDPEADAFFTAQAARAVTPYKADILPYVPEQAASEKILAAGQFRDFFNEAGRRYNNPRQFYFPYTLDTAQIHEKAEELAALARSFDTIIFCIANDTSRRVVSQAAARLSEQEKKLIVISVLEPVHVLDFTWADTILLAYSYSTFSFRAAFSALAGDFVPQGRLPLDTDALKDARTAH
ncbi:MAG: glycoside hydrolase family 3 protein [Treponema sp.]|uniref:glycoside hydrolase family 3 protein n=1 Tax=Treponema sp. TaxID=166 RepID=UPI003FA27C53